MDAFRTDLAIILLRLTMFFTVGNHLGVLELLRTGNGPALDLLSVLGPAMASAVVSGLLHRLRLEFRRPLAGSIRRGC